MKNRTITLLILTLIAILLLGACNQAQPVEAIEAVDEVETVEEVAEAQPEGCLGTAEDAIVNLECREIVFAVENAYLPFNYIVDGEPGGWDYDVFNEICTRLHCTPVFQEASWEGMIQAVADGQFDMAGDGITITDDRLQIVDFSIGYVNIEQKLLVALGEDRFSTIEEFAAIDGLLLGTQVGTTNYETAVQYVPADRIQAFEQYPFAVQALLSGDVDAVILDAVIGVGYVGENAALVELIGPGITSEQLGFAFPKGSDLVAPINLALESMMADGTLNQVNTYYFGTEFTLTYDDID